MDKLEHDPFQKASTEVCVGFEQCFAQDPFQNTHAGILTLHCDRHVWTSLSMILSKKQALRFVLDLNSISWALLDLFKQDPEPNV